MTFILVSGFICTSFICASFICASFYTLKLKRNHSVANKHSGLAVESIV